MTRLSGTNRETVERWLHNPKQNVHNGKRTLFARDGTLYSYGSHFVLATRIGGTVRVNRSKYSVTTSTQAGLVAWLAHEKGLHVRDCYWNENDGGGLQ